MNVTLISLISLILILRKLLCLDMIFDNDPLVSKFISPPKELQSLNCATFYSGMIEAILQSNGYVRTFLLLKPWFLIF